MKISEKTQNSIKINFIELSHQFHYNGIMKNKEAVSAFVALGQESRLNVFRLIVQKGDKGLTPSQIHEMLGIPNATLSFHLKELYQANLISVERQSRNLIYRPNAKLVQNLSEFLLDNCCGGKPCSPVKSSKKVKAL
jgi:DNA-binding transcriptional ArsR family regulator